jgi:integrase
VVFDIGRDEHGKRRQQWVTVKGPRKEAERVARKHMGDVDDEAYVERSKKTLGEFAERWLDSIRATVKPGTLDSYGRLLRQHILPRLGTVPIQKITPDLLNSFYGDLLADGRKDGTGGLSPRTVRYAHAVIHRMLSHAVRWGQLARNPAERASPPRSRPPEMRYWDRDTVRTFLQFVEGDRLVGLWVLAISGGLRRGELLAAKWGDLDGASLSVRRSLVQIGKDVTLAPTKTGRERTVALDEGTLAVLRAHKVRQAETRLAAPDYSDQGLIFCREDGSPIEPAWLTKRFQRLVQEAGLQRIRFHDLRHTAATLAVRAGVHPKAIAERLGHSTVGFTLDRYGHVSPDLQEDAAVKVGGLIFG